MTILSMEDIFPVKPNTNQDIADQTSVNQDPVNQDPVNQDPVNQDPFAQDISKSHETSTASHTFSQESYHHLLQQIETQSNQISILTQQGIEYQNKLQSFEKNILTQFENKIQYDRFKEQQIDKLHNELQKYKSDLILKAVKPVYLGLIRIFDDTSKKIDIIQSKSSDQTEIHQLLSELEMIKTDIIYLLEENDILPYHVEGTHFQPEFQTVTKRIPTQDQELIGRIQKVSLPGFKFDQQVLVKERVYVYSQMA